MATRRNTHQPAVLSPRARTLAVAAGLAVAATIAPCTRAGGGPENVLIIADPSSRESMHLANYYRHARNIPESNVLYLDPDAANYTDFRTLQLPGFLGHLKQRALEDHIDYIVVTPGNSFYVFAPNLVSDGCSPVWRFSIGSVFTMAYIVGDIVPGPIASSYPNRYYSGTPAQAVGFDSNTAWLSGVPSSSVAARRYFIGTQLGYSGLNGNSLDEIKAMIDRSVAADGTFPAGTFYYMHNPNDPPRNVRACGGGSCTGVPTLYNAAVTNMAAAGGLAVVLQGALPDGPQDCLGIMTGFATGNIIGGNFTLRPGSFADHLTSYAATFDESSQTKASAWITKGASGSAGTVDEPCNYTGKFPHSNMHIFYRRGLSLGESYFRSLAFVPFQQLFIGDPITRPFTHIPSVSVPNAPVAPVSGTIVLSPQATTSHPTAGIASYDLLIDGVLHSTALAAGTFTVKTTKLSDGHHDMRVLAYDNSLVKSVGRWAGAITVSNTGSAATLITPVVAGTLTDLFSFTLGATPPGGATLTEVRLTHQGRVIGARATPGSVQVHGQMIGAGQTIVRAEALFSNGQRAVSAPQPLDIAYTIGTPAASAPAAFSFSRDVRPDAPAVIELPGTFGEDPAAAVYTVITPPTKGALTGAGAWRVLTPNANACGLDQFQFRIDTTGGASTVATVSLRYVRPAAACPPDFNGDGQLSVADFGAFQTGYVLADPRADFNGDCALSVGDFGAFQTAYVLGCP
ncbi:MAG: TIGR03790 family protein [Phycisphaerales bacterium]